MKIPLALLDSGSRPFDVVGFGENSLDLVVTVGAFPEANSKRDVGPIGEWPGGQVATAMVACARLGLQARYVGRFGADRAARVGRDALQAAGVDIALTEQVSGAQSRCAVLIVDEGSGSRTVLFHRDARLAWPAETLPARGLAEGRTLLVDATDVPAATRAAQIAHDAGMATVADVEDVHDGVGTLLEHVDVIVAAERFPGALTGERATGAALAALAGRYPRSAVVCVTLGAEGSLARCAGREIRTPGFRVNCADSTGAGDVFRAGFLAAWLKGGAHAEIEDVLRYANAAAALNCRAVGARTAAPTADEVEELLRRGQIPNSKFQAPKE